MLGNVLSLLIHYTVFKIGQHPDTPVFYTHSMGQSRYQIIVQKIPDQEAIAA